MSVTDPIGDMLTVIRNGSKAKKESVLIKRSWTNERILDIFKKEGFISNHKTIEDNKQGMVKVYLRYESDRTSFLTGLKKISKPGRRVYLKNQDIKSVYGGIGLALISTSKGIMTDKEAKDQKVGGEVLCHIW